MISALFVESRGIYFGLPGVDPWDISRDARLYNGPWPVVAHPPCSVWCQLALVNQARYGHAVGEDNGCFKSALSSVRAYGGVLEHPAYSKAWEMFNLTRPKRGNWVEDPMGGWVTEVHQVAYGHRARKATWLYFSGDKKPFDLDWSSPQSTATVSFLTNHGGGSKPRLSKKEAKATPIAFRDTLLQLARSIRSESCAQRLASTMKFTFPMFISNCGGLPTDLFHEGDRCISSNCSSQAGSSGSSSPWESSSESSADSSGGQIGDAKGGSDSSSGSSGGSSDSGAGGQGGNTGAAVGAGGFPEPCGPSNCVGCCGVDGMCKPGTTSVECGGNGESCFPCDNICDYEPSSFPTGYCSYGPGVLFIGCQAAQCAPVELGGKKGHCCTEGPCEDGICT